MKPRTFGDAAVAAYKIYVNGIVEASLSADQLSFSFTKGSACHEYVFQVQVSFSYFVFDLTGFYTCTGFDETSKIKN